MFLRLVKHIIYHGRCIEILRETLFSHKSFSVSEAFRLFDQDQSGSITEAELSKVFAANNIETRDLNRIVDLFGCSKDKTLNFYEFQDMITPKRQPYRSMIGGGFGTVEERKL